MDQPLRKSHDSLELRNLIHVHEPAGSPPLNDDGTVSPPLGHAASGHSAGEFERLKAAVAVAQRLRGEFTTTIFSGLTGGLCVALFNMQPASTTGAMLQEALHFVKDPIVAGAESTAARQMQVLTLLQFSVMLLALGTGTGWGRAGRLRAAHTGSPYLQRILRFMVSTASALALFSLTFCLHANNWILSPWHQTWACGLFAFSTGLLWGIMPEDNATTARSFLMKRAALGDLWALRQIILFLFCVGFAVTLYQNIIVANLSLHLIGTIVLGLGLMDTAYIASSVHLANPLPNTPQTDAARWAPIVCTVLMVAFTIACLSYAGQVSVTDNPVQASASPMTF